MSANPGKENTGIFWAWQKKDETSDVEEKLDSDGLDEWDLLGESVKGRKLLSLFGDQIEMNARGGRCARISSTQG